MRERFLRLLRWSEKYTKTDMVYLASGSFWITGGTLVGGVASFALSIGFANLLPAAVYGTYRFVLAAAAIIAVCSYTGIEAALPQAVARGYEGMLRYGFKLYLKWSVGMLIAGGLAAAYYAWQGNLVLCYAMLIAGAASPIIASATLYTDFLAGKRAFRTRAYWGVANTIGLVAMLFVTILLTHNLLVLVAVYFGGSVILSSFFYVLTLRKFNPNDAVDPDSVRFGGHLSVTNVVGVIADQLDKLLLFHLVGPAELAVYTFATGIPEYLRNASNVIYTLALPKYANRPLDSYRKTIVEKTMLLVGVLVLCAGVYTLLAPAFFHLFYPAYLASIKYTQVYILVAVAGGGASIAAAVLTAQRAVKEQYVLTLSDNFIRIALLVVLAFLYGIWGVVIARILGRLYTLVLATFLAKRLPSHP